MKEGMYMKKLISVFLYSAVTSVIFCSTVLADSNIKVVVNGENIDFTGDQEPVIQKGRTLVPFRAVFEKMGAEVSWFEDIKLCEATYGSITVSIAIGDDKVTIGEGNVIETDVPAQIINGRTMVPLRVLSESIGADVSWDDETKTVEVNTPAISEEIPQSLEYTMAEAESNGIKYSYPVIESDFTTKDKLNSSIEESISNFVNKNVSEGSEIKTSVEYNDSGLLSVVIKEGDSVIYGRTFAVVSGDELTGLDGITEYSSDAIMAMGIDKLGGEAEGYYVTSGGIVFYNEESTVEVKYSEMGNTGTTEDKYIKESYMAEKKKDDGTVYINALVEYPVFKGDEDFIESLNTQFYNSAKKAADSFVASFAEKSENIYDNAQVHLFEPPYNFYGGIEVSEDGENVTVKTTYYEVHYGEDALTYGESVTVNMNTGEVAE